MSYSRINMVIDYTSNITIECIFHILKAKSNTIKILCLGTDKSEQTVQTLIRLQSTVCHFIFIFWKHNCNVKKSASFRTITSAPDKKG